MVFLGVPHSIRSQIWMRTTGALEKKLKSEISYKVVVKTSCNDHLMTSKQIEKVQTVDVFITLCQILVPFYINISMHLFIYKYICSKV